MDPRLPHGIVVVVESEVLGTTAMSVPIRELSSEEAPAPPDIAFAVDQRDIADELERLETRYLNSHKETSDVEIDVAALADAAKKRVLIGDRTWDGIAVDCGWTREDATASEGRRGDGQKVRELLGIAKGTNTTHRTLEYDDANALVKAVGLDPVDVGL